MGQTDIDKQVAGGEPEDYVRKRIYPVKSIDCDKAAEDVSHSGGDSKLPANIKPFTLGK